MDLPPCTRTIRSILAVESNQPSLPNQNIKNTHREFQHSLHPLTTESTCQDYHEPIDHGIDLPVYWHG